MLLVAVKTAGGFLRPRLSNFAPDFDTENFNFEIFASAVTDFEKLVQVFHKNLAFFLTLDLVQD